MVTALGLQARKQQHLKEGRKKIMKETINRFFDFFLFFFFSSSGCWSFHTKFKRSKTQTPDKFKLNSGGE